MAKYAAPPNWIVAATRAAALGVMILGWGPAAAEDSRPWQSANGAAGQSSRRPVDSNVFDRIARWVDRSFDGIDDDVNDTFAGMKQFGSRTGDALKRAAAEGSALTPPRIRIISERRRCPTAANGAPDCQRAAEAACRNHGYAKGSSMQTQSERKCALPRLFSQASVKCHTETHVLRALCQ